MPRVTVVIPLYNKEDFIVEALESVAVQTYPDLKILVIDDRSTDNSLALAQEFAKTNPGVAIEVLENEKNLGVQGNGNRCLDLADTEFIARFDSDDIMPVQRIEKQVAYMDAHPQIVQVGGNLKLIGDEEKLSTMPLRSNEIKAQMPIFNGISQGTSMFRKAMITASGDRYDENGPAVGEDWLLFYKLSRKYPMANLPEVMDIYRIHGGNISIERSDSYYEDIDQVLLYILNDLGIPPSDEELQLHYWLRGQFHVPVQVENVEAFKLWLKKLYSAYTKNKLDLGVLQRFEKRTMEQLYFHVDPKDKACLDHLQKLVPMSETAKKYLKRKRLKAWFGI